MDSGHDKKFWIFQNIYRGQGEVVLLPTQSIVLSFEGGSHRWFTAAHLVIVIDPNDPNERVMREMIMSDWPRPQLDVERFFSGKNPMKAIHSIRSRYRNHRRQVEEDFRAKTGAVATIVLQLVQSKLPGFYAFQSCYVLKPLPEKGAEEGPPTILYEHTIRIDDHHCSRFIKLTCGEAGVRDSDDERDDLPASPLDLEYHFRVLPVGPLHPPRKPTLPPSTVRLIVDYASNWEGDPAWAKTILSCALVNKSWLHTLAVYWERVGTGKISIENLRGLIHSLELQPHYVPHLAAFRIFQTLTPGDHTLEIGGHNQITSALTLPAFFRSAVMLKSITITFEFLDGSKKELAALKHVRSLHLTRRMYVTPDRRFLPISTFLSIRDVLAVITEWESLKKLEVLAWGDNSIMDAPPRQPPDIHLPVSYSLEELSLFNMDVSISDLLAMASNSGQTLTTVRIRSISLSNAEFTTFFLHLRSCVERLEIYDITVTNSDLDEPEEPAFDAAISQMTRLKKVIMSRPLISNNGIARTRRSSLAGLLELRNYTTSTMCGTAHEISLSKAIEEGSWREIRVRLSREDHAYYITTATSSTESELRSEIHEATRIAEQKGTSLSVHWVG